MKLQALMSSVSELSVSHGDTRYVVTRCYNDACPLLLVPDYLWGHPCPTCQPSGSAIPPAPADEYPCVHCNEFRRDHATVLHQTPRVSVVDYACLFSPTKFEPMTQQELEARFR